MSAGKRDQIEIFFKKKFLSKIDVDLIIWSRTFVISKKNFLSIWSLFPALTPTMQKALLHLINACICLSVIPADWLDAFVYPIPKPTEWQHELKHTRPITLLEVPRKLMVKVLNTCLSNLMALHPILKGQQFAAKPGASTMEPIRIMNEIIDDAKENNKELWILFQDLSKCYDRVDINILRKAMQRIIICFINNYQWLSWLHDFAVHR